MNRAQARDAEATVKALPMVEAGAALHRAEATTAVADRIAVEAAAMEARELMEAAQEALHTEAMEKATTTTASVIATAMTGARTATCSSAWVMR